MGEQPQRGLVGNAHQGALGLFAGIAERQGMKHATIPGIRVDDVADELDQTEVEQTVPAGPELFPASGFLFLACGAGQERGNEWAVIPGDLRRLLETPDRPPLPLAEFMAFVAFADRGMRDAAVFIQQRGMP